MEQTTIPITSEFGFEEPAIVEVPEPSIEMLQEAENYGQFRLGPLGRGYATTLGTPLRRVLLSSLKGAAVTWIKIDGVLHEYSAIPGMRENVQTFILNVKKIRLRGHTDRPGKMRLEASGEGELSAGDIIAPSDFEIVNPELRLGYIDNADASVSIEFNVETGEGYVPAASHEGFPIGHLPIDAIYSPVVRVNYSVERTRVGQFTNYESLLLEIWTDGTKTPTAAIQEATDTLLSHFFILKNIGTQTQAPTKSMEISPEIYNMPLEQLELTGRTFNAMKRHGLSKVGELLGMAPEEWLSIRNFGEKSRAELNLKLQTLGLLDDEDPTLGEAVSDINQSDEEGQLTEELEYQDEEE
jgi:DNA-directed RNA polymerase subunit alpha